MNLSLNQAAKQAKVAKTSLLTALKNGDVSGTKSEKGHWQIEESELLRWIGTRSSKPVSNSHEIHLDPPDKPIENRVLEREIELLRERLADKDAVIDDLRRRLDEESEDRRKLASRLLAGPEMATQTRRRWWLWPLKRND
jgi:molecular chaperone GrpE (heat shock protein)